MWGWKNLKVHYHGNSVFIMTAGLTEDRSHHIYIFLLVVYSSGELYNCIKCFKNSNMVIWNKVYVDLQKVILCSLQLRKDAVSPMPWHLSVHSTAVRLSLSIIPPSKG